jgi:hypothetical protein
VPLGVEKSLFPSLADALGGEGGMGRDKKQAKNEYEIFHGSLPGLVLSPERATGRLMLSINCNYSWTRVLKSYCDAVTLE